MIRNEICYADLDQLYLDPFNPRLGRENVGPDIKQGRVLELMQDWTLDELAVSFLESGYWPHEALLVVKDKLYGKQQLVVVEGNRRLAALKILKQTLDGRGPLPKWKEFVKGIKPPPNLFTRIPYILADSRKDVDAFLGFRHVTGIKEWHPAEKAEFIAKLIDEQKLSYEAVMRKIGSNAPTVRQNYIAYRILREMENHQDISLESVEKKFSVLYLSLRSSGVQKYLHVDIKAGPQDARKPVPLKYQKQLINFARWLFGDKNTPPLFTDSRNVDKFGEILESEKAVEYLERTPKPNFEYARQISGGDEPELVKLIDAASDNIEQVLSRVHLFKNSKRLGNAVSRLRAGVEELFEKFPVRNSEN